MTQDNTVEQEPPTVLSIFLAILMFISMPAFAGESAYERIIRTGEIRCGYGISDPWLYYNFETGQPEGLARIIAEALAEKISLKLVWGEETGWGNLGEALYSGRIDLVCSTLWSDPSIGRKIAFTDPVFYNEIHAFTRADETRFQTAADIDKPETILAIQDGGYSADIAKRLFSHAKQNTIPQASAWTDLFLNVANGKADVIFTDYLSIQNFNKNNPKQQLKKIPLAEPVTVYGTAFAVSIKEHELKEMIQTAVRHMVNSGEIETLTEEFRKLYPDVIVLPKKAF